MGNLKLLDFVDPETGMVFCKCGSHAFLVDVIPDDGLVEISMWARGTPTFTWWNKVRAIWRIIWTGTPYADQLTLDKSGVGDLIRHLSIVHRKL